MRKTHMSQNIEEGMRQRVAEFLPDAIGNTLESYKDFLERDEQSEQPKEFSAHHSACKVAIAHLELLLKLAQVVNVEENIMDEKKEFTQYVLTEAAKHVRENNMEENAQT